jgi:hypothetical protein
LPDRRREKLGLQGESAVSSQSYSFENRGEYPQNGNPFSFATMKLITYFN